MVFFFIGSLSICALPPLNGFVSKWFIYRSLLDISNQSSLILDRAGALLVASILAIIGALALACFTKALGVAFLGRPRSHVVNKAQDGSKGALLAQGILAAICILLGIFAGPLIDKIQPAVHCAMIEHHTPKAVFQLPLAILLITGVVLCITLAQLFLKKPGSEGLKSFSTWDCGYGKLPGRAEISGTSFADSIATLIHPILGYSVARFIKGKDRRHFPEQVNVQPTHTPVLEKCIYAPLTAALRWTSQVLVALQTGSIHVHLLYVFMTVFILVLLGIRL